MTLSRVACWCVTTILLWLGGFFAGAIPFGVLIARSRGVDIRNQGSGNIGASNVARVIGLGPGLAVLVLDAAKGAVAVLVAGALGGTPGVVAITGFAAIAGHCFSPFLGGKGGKGVATALGVFAVVAPALAVVAASVFALIGGRTRTPSLGSLAGVTAATVFAFATHAAPSIQMLVAATLALLLYTHRRNLAKLTSSH